MTSEQTYYKILWVDADEIICQSLQTYLTHYHPFDYKLIVETCKSPTEAIERLEQAQGQYDLLISETHLPLQKDSIQLIETVQQNYPNIKTIYMSAARLEDAVKVAKQANVYTIITKAVPFEFETLSRTIHNTLVPSAATGLATYLEKDAEIYTLKITSSEEIMTVLGTLADFFRANSQKMVDPLITVTIEALTNSVYHSNKNVDGSSKYQKGQVIEALDPSEYVTVQYGKDQQQLGFSICDQGGTLKPEDVLFWLERNITCSGLLDTHGRGLYLMHTLVDRFLINITPGKQTELVALDKLVPQQALRKSLYINAI